MVGYPRTLGRTSHSPLDAQRASPATARLTYRPGAIKARQRFARTETTGLACSAFEAATGLVVRAEPATSEGLRHVIAGSALQPQSDS